MTIFFCEAGDAFGAFSNFSQHGVDLDGEWWPTVEHYFQAQKFDDAAYRTKIRTAPSPTDAATLGRSHEASFRLEWEDMKDSVMRRAVRRKFETHAEARALLLSTGDSDIVETAPGDYYWGRGADGSGKNMLGKILIETRHTLRGRGASSTST